MMTASSMSVPSSLQCVICRAMFASEASLHIHQHVNLMCSYWKQQQHQQQQQREQSNVNTQTSETSGGGDAAASSSNTRMIPSVPELYDIILQQEERIKRLEMKDRTFLRNSIPIYLNRTFKPPETFTEWFHAIPITRDHLLYVLYEPRGNLIDGIKKVVTDFLRDAYATATEDHADTFPVRCYLDKPHTMFIYDDVSMHHPTGDYKWQICHIDQWRRIMDQMHDRFRMELYRYEADSDERFERFFKEKELYWNVMTRVTISMTERQKAELKSWFYTYMARPFQP